LWLVGVWCGWLAFGGVWCGLVWFGVVWWGLLWGADKLLGAAGGFINFFCGVFYGN
jgi:hypothetical protein